MARWACRWTGSKLWSSWWRSRSSRHWMRAPWQPSSPQQRPVCTRWWPSGRDRPLNSQIKARNCSLRRGFSIWCDGGGCCVNLLILTNCACCQAAKEHITWPFPCPELQGSVRADRAEQVTQRVPAHASDHPVVCILGLVCRLLVIDKPEHNVLIRAACSWRVRSHTSSIILTNASQGRKSGTGRKHKQHCFEAWKCRPQASRQTAGHTCNK